MIPVIITNPKSIHLMNKSKDEDISKNDDLTNQNSNAKRSRRMSLRKMQKGIIKKYKNQNVLF